jgi:hypothetical protein
VVGDYAVAARPTGDAIEIAVPREDHVAALARIDDVLSSAWVDLVSARPSADPVTEACSVNAAGTPIVDVAASRLEEDGDAFSVRRQEFFECAGLEVRLEGHTPASSVYSDAPRPADHRDRDRLPTLEPGYPAGDPSIRG